MTSLPVSVAFIVSLVLGFAAAGTAMPPKVIVDPNAAESAVIRSPSLPVWSEDLGGGAR